jgi:ferredoxin
MSLYKQLIIYYFSGTGNSKHVSTWFSEVAKEKQVPIQLINISEIDRKHISIPSGETLIGFCSPTHGFNYPPVMMHFIFRFPKANRNQVILMNTRAGVKIYKLIVPGLSGAALILSAIVLLLKGYNIVGMRSIDLPSNWISLHPGLRKNAIESLFKKFKEVTYNFANQILEGKKVYRALYSLPVDIAIAPIAFFYYFFGRFIFAKSFYASRKCDNCGLCIRQCPVKAIRLVDNRPFWSYRCESCMHCMNSCPVTAIETAHGFIIGVFILFNTILQSFVYIGLLNNNIEWFSESAKYGLLSRFVFETIIAFFALIISYWLVHYLRRFKIVDLLIKYTSLTVFKFWGRYKPNRIIKN